MLRIIDGHLHLVTAGMLRRAGEQRELARAIAAHRAADPRNGVDDAAEGATLEQLAEQWSGVLARDGVEAGFFIAIGEGNEELAEFIRLGPERFYGWGSVVDPTDPAAAAVVRRFHAW